MCQDEDVSSLSEELERFVCSGFGCAGRQNGVGTGWRREFLALKRQEGDLTDGKKGKYNFAF